MKHEEMIERGFTTDSNGLILDNFGNEYRNEEGSIEYLDDEKTTDTEFIDEWNQPAQDASPSWVDKHSVNCFNCGLLVDERECIVGNNNEGNICPKCQHPTQEKNNMTKHTPTPWILNNNGGGDIFITDNDDKIIVESMDGETRRLYESEANAQLIIKAVNSHEKIVEALKKVLKMINNRQVYDKDAQSIIKQALKSAGEI
jgi:hypothetical protein